jgi:hypothetical protein
MLINDVVAMLMDIPPMLAAQWAAWFTIGLALSIWTRREKSRLVVHGSSSPRQRSSGSRPVARPVKTVVHQPPSGDAFGELEALFNEVQEGSHRPGEPLPVSEPAVSEPLRNAPVLASPQSLP